MAISFNSLGGYGYLGNQMFQYAATRGIAEYHGYEFSIPESGHRLLDVFEMPNAKLLQKNDVTGSLTHEGFHFDQELFETCPDNVDLHGYFQTEKYFSHIKESIKEDFKFKNPDNEMLNAIKNDIGKRKIVSVHVRRGDYLSLPNHHPVCDLSYYEKAMSLFTNALFIVASNDPQWCSEQSIFSESIILGRSDVEDLYIMSQSDHNIIANSSFSWWGAWLNKNPYKVVVAPKVWFGSAYGDFIMSDLLPVDWTQI